MIKILFLLHRIDFGGTEGQIIKLTDYLASRNYKTHMATLKNLSKDVSFLKNERITEFQFRGFKNRGFFTFLKALLNFCDTASIDIVQSHFINEDLIALILKLLRPRICFIMAKRNLLYRRLPLHLFLLENYCMRRADAIITNSNGVRDRYKSLFRIRDKEIKVLYNGVDTKIYSPVSEENRAAVKAEMGLKRTDFVVGSVANWRDEKDPFCLLEAARLCKDYDRKIKFVVVGEGLLIDDMSRFVMANKLNNVHLVGKITPALGTMRAFNIGVSTSVAEGFSNVILEFMALGLPVVATAVGGTSEVVVHTRTGYLFEPKDPKGLCSYITKLKNESDLCARMGRLARARIKTEFSLDKMISRYDDFYRSLISERRSGQ
ncbi:MAG: glycosyltransferase family 4 protein [bacterium]|nr:MAG: glycosyltransferase family 4 protein [bacterium]